MTQSMASNAGLRGPASSTDNAIARFDGTTGRVVQNSGVTIDDSGVLQVDHITEKTGGHDVVFDAAVETPSIRLTGAEHLRIYTYQHTITAGEVTATQATQTVTAITQSKVRALLVVGNDLSAPGYVLTPYQGGAAGYNLIPYMDNTTTVKINLGVTWAANDTISITIIEAL
jgi:hypothetical protein